MRKKNNTIISERFLKKRLDEEPNLSQFAKKLSENELSGKSITAVRQAIMKVENGDQTMPPLYLIKAYCKHFNTTSDYLLGIRDVETTDENIAMICKYTGLSDTAIERISNYGEQQREILNALITGVENDNDCILSLLTSLWFYALNVGSSTLTINNYLYGDSNIDDRDTVNNMLKFDVAEHLDFILLTVRNLFIPKKNEVRKLKEEELELRIELEAKKQGITSDELKAILKQSTEKHKKKGSDTNETT